MQKAPVMKGSGLKPLDECKSNEEVHVFGKNLEERVITKDEEESPSISINNSQIDEDIDSIRKRKFDAITGEEDEETAFQGDFKLFIWDLPTSNWVEKGRGQLKLNDSKGQSEKRSRLIMRVSGTLRIILNVAVDSTHFKVIANSKNNIRFTDSQTVWAARGSNANQLRDLLEDRLKLNKKRPQPDLEDQASSKRTKPEVEDQSSSKKTEPEVEDQSPSKRTQPEVEDQASSKKTELEVEDQSPSKRTQPEVDDQSPSNRTKSDSDEEEERQEEEESHDERRQEKESQEEESHED